MNSRAAGRAGDRELTAYLHPGRCGQSVRKPAQSFSSAQAINRYAAAT